jgi:hypothetical protein
MVTHSKAAIPDLSQADSMAPQHLEHVSAAPWFRVALAGGQLFRSLNLGVLRRTVADVHAQYEAPILVLQKSREGWHYRFGLLLQRADKHPGLLINVVESYFSLSRVFGRPKWHRLRRHLGGPEDPVTNAPMSSEGEYRLIATTAIWLTLRVEELAETGVQGLKGTLDGMRISGVYRTLRRVIRDVVRRDAHGPLGEGEYRNQKRLRLDEASDRIVEHNVKALTGKITKEYYPESSPGTEAELVASDSESEFPKAIDLESLSPAERTAVERISDGFREGYKFDGKRKDSMREFLGHDYEATMRAFRRARRTLKAKP